MDRFEIEAVPRCQAGSGAAQDEARDALLDFLNEMTRRSGLLALEAVIAAAGTEGQPARLARHVAALAAEAVAVTEDIEVQLAALARLQAATAA
jgi:hypothetical protein